MTTFDRLAAAHSPLIAAVWGAAFADALRRGTHGQARHYELADGTYAYETIDASAFALEEADAAAELAMRAIAKEG